MLQRAIPRAVIVTLLITIALYLSVALVSKFVSFSAFTVLVYYVITNLCAIRMKPEERLYSIWPDWV